MTPRRTGRSRRHGQHRKTVKAGRVLQARQLLSDTVSAMDLWLILGGVAIVLMLAWLF